MSGQAVPLTQCPFAIERDDRLSATIAHRGGFAKSVRTTTDFAGARAILRDATARQAGFRAELVSKFGSMRPPVLFQTGDTHRLQRKATARFFAPKVVATRYRAVMTAETERLVALLRRDGRADLDTLALELAVTVAADIVGLTNSDSAGMARRLESFASGGLSDGSWFARMRGLLVTQSRVTRFFRMDVRPAIAARRAVPRDDVISHLIAEGYSEKEILTECITYGAAGMITTREFITMAGWHLFRDDDLRTRFLGTDEGGRLAVLEEILRLEPVVGTLYRRLADESVVAIDVRAANADREAIGTCPHRIDPDRDTARKTGGAMMAFGDGEHRCPGNMVALHEAAIFLDAVLRVPGIRLERAPDMGWNPLITGYELRGATLGCDR